MMTDPIADMLTRIRNAVRIERPHVEMPLSKVKCGVAEVLKREGYMWDWREVDGTPVGVSNDIVLFSAYKERYQPESAAGGFPAIPVAVGIVAFAISTTLAYAATIRRRTSQ